MRHTANNVKGAVFYKDSSFDLKKKRLSDIIFLVVCAVLVLSLGIGVYALPRPEMSEAENRSLADMPKLSVRRLLNGEFFTSLSLFYSDRIPLRQQMIQAAAVCELSLGKIENNGVRFENGRLVDRCLYKSFSLLEKNLNSLKGFSEQSGALCTIIPRSVDIYTESEEAESVLARLNCSGLASNELYESLSYYKTDHHLDAQGAFAVYEHITEGLGYRPMPMESFALTEVSDSFLGMVYSRCGLLPIYNDTVGAWRYEGDTDFEVICKDSGCGQCRLYDETAIERKDKYEYFLGGNHGVLTVSSNQTGREHIFLIKDSFANAVIPMLARHFDITVYDPRYTSLPPEIPSGARVVVLCGLDTLATTGFAELLQ